MQNHTIKLPDGRELGYGEYGKHGGTALLLFHGTPGSRVFGRFDGADWIDAAGLRIVTPERPGYGLSSPAPRRRIADWAADVEALADQLGIDRFHVAGGSGGGPYALACALRLPSRVQSATLFSSGGPPEVMRLSKDMQGGNRIAFFAARYAPLLLKALTSMTANAIRKQPQQYLRKLKAQLPESDRALMDDGTLERTMMQLTEAYRQGGDGAYRDMRLVSQPWGLDLGTITVPVFLWHGEADNLVPVATARAFADMIPGCESHFITDAGHQLLGDDRIRAQMIARMLAVHA
ncbi:alpha/beta fold hydrolase [Solimonas marina]|uniref:Alpha/beta hydrolase n=1 Tax=Solimonas marina TaxID=2714601 RepID=A0A969W7S7_9GAMM|nr:alpha/beta hydrolase [Solimonas marina]NKF21063.1 alpha/beta hydrolase [Solimonas marina]